MSSCTGFQDAARPKNKDVKCLSRFTGPAVRNLDSVSKGSFGQISLLRREVEKSISRFQKTWSG